VFTLIILAPSGYCAAILLAAIPVGIIITIRKKLRERRERREQEAHRAEVELTLERNRQEMRIRLDEALAQAARQNKIAGMYGD
jgi:hypothetical protein